MDSFPSPLRVLHFLLALLLAFICFAAPAHGNQGLEFRRTLHRLIDSHSGQTGAYVLEKGEEALLARAWMVDSAGEGIDILTFIWSLDNIGTVGTETLLRAAERGVKVRVLVDDMLLDEVPEEVLLALAAHPNFAIRVYNPLASIGVNTLEMIGNFLFRFRRFNHRLHNKSFLADRVIGICGGRNVADEYFDNDQKYNFLDRDILVVGPVVERMGENFELFWRSRLARPIEALLPEKAASLDEERRQGIYRDLHDRAERLNETLPMVQSILEDGQAEMARILGDLAWSGDVWFVSDPPGKNLGKPGLGGGGRMAEALEEAIATAKKRITIQSPYMVLHEGDFGLFEKRRQGVEVRISTNSLASTDNVAAFSGYGKIRQKLLESGMVVREFRPNPAIEADLMRNSHPEERNKPIVTMHAKTVIIDGELLYIGTFNLDPRSVHLNTEEGVFVRDRRLAREVEEAIEREMQPGNSWNPRVENPDRHAGIWRRMKLWFFSLFPIEPVL